MIFQKYHSRYLSQIPLETVLFPIKIHGGHVGVQNNREKKSWEFDSLIMQNLGDVLPLFCTPTWPSHHVSENQELFVYLSLWAD